MKKLFAGKYSGIVTAIALFVLLVAAVLVANFYMAAKFAGVTEMVNLAARQQTLSQQTFKALLQTDNALGSGNLVDKPLDEFKRSFRVFDETLVAFQDGGEVTNLAGERVVIEPLRDPVLRESNASAQAVWAAFRDKAQFVADFEGRIERDADFEVGDIEADLESAMYEAIVFSAENNVSADLLESINQVAVGLEQQAAAQAQRLQIVQVVGIVLALGAFALIVFHFLRNLRRSDEALAIAEEEKDEILNTVNEGLFLLDEDLRIGSQHSKAIETIFRRENLAGQDFMQLLREIVPEKTLETARDYVGLFFAGRVNEKLVNDLNPLDEVEVHFRDAKGGYVTRYLGFSFKRVVVTEDLSHLLVTVNDITEIVGLKNLLEQAQDHGKLQLDMLMDMLHIEPSLLDDFLSNTDENLDAINNALKSSGNTQAKYLDKLNEMFRRTHTVKGEASALGLSSVASLAHDLEEHVSELTNSHELKGGDFLPLTMRLDELMSHMSSVRKLIERLAEFRRVVEHGDGSAAAVSDDPQAPERRRSERQSTPDMLASLAEKLSNDEGKRVEVVCSGFDLRGVSADVRKALRDISVQFLRNSVVHGIESPDERKSADKVPVGRVAIVVSRKGDQVELNYRDDGRGLDAEKIRASAIDKGVLTAEKAAAMNEKQLMSLIFKRGFSTADAITDNAGRGVGMDVIRESIQKLGGKVRMSTTAGHQTAFTVSLPMKAAAENVVAA
jgi:HPt (histidine-containing phosphotransfer) domain-containing protein/PAS domain-containing protein